VKGCAEQDDDLSSRRIWNKLVDVQAFKQKQMLSSVSMSDIIIEILKDTIDHSSYYQGILSGKFTPEGEQAPAMKERISKLEGEKSCRQR